MSIDVNVQNDLVVVTESSEDIVVNVSNAAGPAGAAGVGVPVGGATGQVLKKFTNTDYDTYWAADASGLTSVGLSMPTAFTVSNTPLTTNGTLAVTGAGTAAQYIRGDGQLATFPSSASGGSSVNYYLNGSVNASVAGYKQLSNTATIGGGTDFTLVGNGLIAQFLTDVGNPNRIEIPGGAWNFEMFFQVSSSGGNQKFYVELLKYNGTTFTSIASSSAVPEEITGGTAIDLYLTSLAVPTTALLITDRLVIRVYIVDNSGGRTVTLHTEDNTLCEIVTTFAGGISALNGLSANTQYLATGTSGTDFAISSLTDTHTFNLPTASATNRGALSSADWTTFNNKVPTTRTLTINGTAYDLSADRSWTVSGAANTIYTADGTLTSARTVTSGGFPLTFTGSNTAAIAIARGLNLTHTLVAAANNDVLVGLDVNPTFTNGAFTNVSNIALRVSNNLLVSKNFNGVLNATVSNTLAGGTDTSANFVFSTNAGNAIFGKYSTTTSGYKILSASDAYLYNAPSGNISILNDNSSGLIRFAAGSSSTAQMTLTAAGRLLLGTTTEGTYLLDVNGTARVSGALVINGSTGAVAGSIFLDSTFGIGILGKSGSTYDATITDSSLAPRIGVKGSIVSIIGSLNVSGNALISGTYVGLSGNKGIYNASNTGTTIFGDTTSSVFSVSIGSGNGIDGLWMTSNGKVNIGAFGSTYNASAILEAVSTTKGFLPPRMTTTEKNAIGTPAAGLMVFDTTLAKLCVYSGTAWETITSI